MVVKNKVIESGLSLKEILIDLKFCKSNGESKRLISQGAVKINNDKITDKELLMKKDYFINHPNRKKYLLCRYSCGKNKYGIVELIPKVFNYIWDKNRNWII